MRTGAAIAVLAVALAGVSAVAVSHSVAQRARTRPHADWDLRLAPGFFNAAQVEPATDHSWLTMRCEGSAPRYERMHCEFEHVSISLQSDEDVQAHLAAFDEGARTEPINLSQLRTRCAELADPPAPCECFGPTGDASRACVIASLRRAAELRERACRLRHSTFSADFDRVGRTRWTATLTGLICSNVTALVLDSDDSFLRWRYSQTRVAVDSADDALCGGLTEGSVSRFDTDADDFVPIGCAGLVPRVL